MLPLPCSACLLVEYAENFGIETMAAGNIREWTHTEHTDYCCQVCVLVPYHLGGMGMGLHYLPDPEDTGTMVPLLVVR